MAPKSNEEASKRLNTLVEAGDPIAIYNLGVYYWNGRDGFPQDYKRALELYHRATELSYAKAYCNIAYSYDTGSGVDVDKEKATHYYELAAMRGGSMARHNLAANEGRAGNHGRALRHYMIAVRDGFSDSLERIKQLYTTGFATKEDYTTALRSYQMYLSEIKSKQRDEAAAADEKYRYY